MKECDIASIGRKFNVTTVIAKKSICQLSLLNISRETECHEKAEELAAYTTAGYSGIKDFISTDIPSKLYVMPIFWHPRLRLVPQPHSICR